MIYVGLADYYRSRRACLLIEAGVADAIHPGEKIKIPTGGGLALVSYLEEAAKLDPQPSPLLETIQKLKRMK